MKREWLTKAACRNARPEIFFPKSTEDEDAAAARRVCRSCPVALECLRDALETGEPHGIRGGQTSRQRKALLKKARRAHEQREVCDAA